MLWLIQSITSDQMIEWLIKHWFRYTKLISVVQFCLQNKLSWQEVEDLLLSDVEVSVADVVCRCLPVSVDEAAAPAVLTHWDNRNSKQQFTSPADLGSRDLIPAFT